MDKAKGGLNAMHMVHISSHCVKQFCTESIADEPQNDQPERNEAEHVADFEFSHALPEGRSRVQGSCTWHHALETAEVDVCAIV